MIEQGVISRQLLEVYKTNEKDFKPYDENYEEEKEEDKKGFNLHQGKIEEIYYYPHLSSTNFEMDYEGINNNGSVTIPYSKINLKECYKGVRIGLKKDWEKHGETLNLKNMPVVLLGFITDIKFSENTANFGLSGMTKLLEKNHKFDFTQMKRSKILEEVIKTAGLIPVVNVNGLVDEVIDYSNQSESDDETGDFDGSVPASISELAKKITKGVKGVEAKAKAIYNWIDPYISYDGYNGTRRGAEKTLQDKMGNCCDTSHLYIAMCRAVGIEAEYCHGPGHVWARVKLKNGWHEVDPIGTRYGWNRIWNNLRAHSYKKEIDF